MFLCSVPRRVAAVSAATVGVAALSTGILISVSAAAGAVDGGSAAAPVSTPRPTAAATAPADILPVASAAPAQTIVPAAASQLPAPVPTPRPTAAPTPRPAAAAPRPAVAVHHPAPAPAAPVTYRNRLVSADGSLNTGVGTYSDCTGQTALTHASAAIDTCVTDVVYFIGHNPGVFTPLLHMGSGSVITYWDGSGTAHRYQIVASRTWYRSNGVPAPVGGAAVEFQTCLTADGSVDRILDAVAI